MRRYFLRRLAAFGFLATASLRAVTAARGAGDEEGDEASSPVGRAFAIGDLIRRRDEQGRPYLPFLDVPTLSMGIYALPAGGEDGQSPHRQDEVYYVIEGEGVLRVEGTDYPAKPGELLFVKAEAEHRFHSITEDLTLLVFFSKA